jgi:hypothetical protein
LNLTQIVTDGAVLSLLASLVLIAVLRFNPRLFLQDYPDAIREAVPPKTERERRQSLLVSIPFLALFLVIPVASTLALKRSSPLVPSFLQLSLHAFGVVFIFNLVDLLLLDWVMFCLITPKFIIVPGTEEMKEYKDYAYHFRAFMKGTILSFAAGLAIGGVVSLL